MTRTLNSARGYIETAHARQNRTIHACIRPGGLPWAQSKSRNAPLSIAAALVACLAAGRAIAADPPDSRINPVTGYVETVDSTWSGSSWDIRHTTSNGSAVVTFIVSAAAADDHAPRIHVSSGGTTTVVWWRDLSSDEVRFRRFDSGGWTLDRRLSGTSPDARAPELASLGSDLWFVYESHGSSTTSLIVGIIDDEPDPIGTLVGETSYDGDVDVRIQSEQGHLWVSWMHDGSTVAWAEWSSGGDWTAAAYQAVSNGDLGAAHSAVRATVLGP